VLVFIFSPHAEFYSAPYLRTNILILCT